VQFVKMHGAGNDFVLVDLLTSRDDRDDAYWAELARQMCDRHFGVGSDGLLLIVPSDQADARMRMFNPDGSESASCGNGVRCLGRYVHDRYGLGDPELRVETGAGVTVIAMREDGDVTVNMGRPILAPREIPVAVVGTDALDVALDVAGEHLMLSCASMGNPHAVTFVGPGVLEGYELERIGPQVEHAAIFPQRTNFEVCEVLNPEHLRVRVWERGAGITLACGTGACATAVVAERRGLARFPMQVDLPGGSLTIDRAPDGAILMTGPTAYVFTGAWSLRTPAQSAIPNLNREAIGVG
jgi:diaminopimelate epimerase